VAIFLHNRIRRNHRFPFSFLLAIFCLTRIAALSLRIAWSRNLTNVNVAIAAGVFTAAGVLILYVVNIFLTVRLVRGCVPRVGWGKGVYWGLRGLLASVVGTLVMVVVCSVHSLFTLDTAVRGRERLVLLFAGVYMTCLAVLPAVVVGVLWLLRGRWETEEFGTGRMRTKMVLLVFTSLVLTLGAGFRCGVNFAARPVTQPAWYHSRPPFYCFNFVIELVVVYTYAIVRFDRRFHVPGGSSGPGDYSARNKVEGPLKSGGSAAAKSMEKRSADSGV
jgi:hypothetical protein